MVCSTASPADVRAATQMQTAPPPRPDQALWACLLLLLRPAMCADYICDDNWGRLWRTHICFYCNQVGFVGGKQNLPINIAHTCFIISV